MFKHKIALVVFALFLAACNPQVSSQPQLPRDQLPESQPPLSDSSVSSGPRTEPQWTRWLAEQCEWRCEVVTKLGTRCDLLSEEYAIEVEWPSHAWEAPSQAWHYASQFERKPAILFLLSDRETYERRYVMSRVGDLARKLDIEIVWFDTISRKFIVDGNTQHIKGCN